MTDTPTWFEDEFEPRPRRRLVVAGAAVAVAWAVVAAAVLLLGGGGDTSGGGEPARTGAVGGPPVGEEAPPPANGDATDAPGRAGDGAFDAVDGSAPGEDGRDAPPSPGATTVSRDAAEAIAVAVARAWLSDGGPDLHVPGVTVDRRAYLEHATVEAFDLAGPDLAVARLQLVLLVHDGEHYTDVLVRRGAVPLLLSADEVTPAGQPWFLPGAPELTTTAPATTPVEDAEVAAAVTAALAGAGYREPEVGGIGTTPEGVLVAQVLASTPEDEVIDGPVWLAPTPDGLVVLGAADG